MLFFKGNKELVIVKEKENYIVWISIKNNHNHKRVVVSLINKPLDTKDKKYNIEEYFAVGGIKKIEAFEILFNENILKNEFQIEKVFSEINKTFKKSKKFDEEIYLTIAKNVANPKLFKNTLNEIYNELEVVWKNK